MLVRFVVRLAYLAAGALVVSALAPAQSVPDLTATFEPAHGLRAGYANPGYSITNVEPEMTPWALEQYKKIREGTVPKDPKRLQRVGIWDRGKENLDPSEIHCLPWGPTRLYTWDHPFEIIQKPDIVYLLFEGDHEVRRVYLDGRTHQGMYETYTGHSIGHYEGDTLVVDTVGLNRLTWIDEVGHVHSNQLHIVERIRRPEPNILQIDFTFDDPKAYPKPWTGKRVFDKVTGAKAEILEYVTCQDHLESDHIPRLLKGLPEIVEKEP
jgi:hypothetical protein